MSRIQLLAGLVAVSGWLAALLVWRLFDDEYEHGYAEGLADGEDSVAQEAGA